MSSGTSDRIGNKMRAHSEELAAEISNPDVERELRRFHARHRNPRTRSHGIWFGAALATTSALVAVMVWHAMESPVATVDHETVFADRSIMIVDRNTQAKTDIERRNHIVVLVERGRAQFKVTRRPERVFEVKAGELKVQVIGTTFSVERFADTEARVVVESGVVRVQTDRVAALRLTAGQSFDTRDATEPLSVTASQARASPPGASQPEASPGAAEAAEPEQTGRLGGSIEPAAGQNLGQASPSRARREKSRRMRRPATDVSRLPEGHWRRLLKMGRPNAAYEAMKAKSRESLETDPASLLDAADAARLSGHYTHAAKLFRSVMQRFPQHPENRNAAFLLGDVLLLHLEQPCRAAEAFRSAQSLSGDGPLASDALAYRVQSLSACGKHDTAVELAAMYLRRYPNGVKAGIMQRVVSDHPHR
ncbi:MAG: FecR domain-containing protein [Myxococcota bacterium]